MEKTIFHICNPATLEPTGFRNIVSMAELESSKEAICAAYVINVHLNWAGRKLSSNYGFDIANFIRTKIKSLSPVIFYSPIQVKYFERKSESQIKYKILFGRGSAFIEVPFKESELNKIVGDIKPLSKAALHDVVTMLCNLKGVVIDKLNHDLKFDADVDKVISMVSPYLSGEQKKLISIEMFVLEIKERIKSNDEKGFLNEKLKFIALCNQELTEKGKENKLKNRAKHRILFLDDLTEEIAKAKKYLGEDFIVEATTSGEKAISVLKKDLKNEIVAVIADWRLFTNEKQNYWQAFQGYDVLDFASMNGIRSLFALTSQADFVVHQLRNLMGIRFSLFKKENLNSEGQWMVFADVLYEACIDAIHAKAAILDDFPIWKKIWTEKRIPQLTLRDQYIELWNSIDRDSELNLIDRKVNEMWNYLLNSKDPYLIGQEVFKDYGISHKNLRLNKILVLRRVWFGLWFRYMPQGRINADSIRELAHLVYSKLFGSPGDGSITQRTFNLCIHLDKVKKEYMFPEEIEWLIRKDLFTDDTSV